MKTHVSYHDIHDYAKHWHWQGETDQMLVLNELKWTGLLHQSSTNQNRSLYCEELQYQGPPGFCVELTLVWKFVNWFPFCCLDRWTSSPFLKLSEKIKRRASRISQSFSVGYQSFLFFLLRHYNAVLSVDSLGAWTLLPQISWILGS